MKPRGCLLVQSTYKPGDQPLEGYLAWHEWARSMRAAGFRQARCPGCGRFEIWSAPKETVKVGRIHCLTCGGRK